MKRLFSFLTVIACAGAIFSCAKEAQIEKTDEDVVVDNPTEEPAKTFEYTFVVSNGDASSADKDTKSILNSDANGLFLQWESTDKLNTWALYTGGNGSFSYNNESSVDASTNPVTFTIVSYRALEAGDMVYAKYPYASGAGTTPATTLEIPADQTQDGTSFDASAMPMVAEPFGISAAVSAQGSNNETSKVHFYNLGGIVEFDIFSSTGAYAAESIKSVTFESTSSIAGSFSYDLRNVDVSNLETLNITGYTETSVTTSVTGLSVGDATSVSNAKKVYMVLAPGSYTGTVTLKTNAATYEYTISSAKAFQRAKVKRLGLNLESATCTRELVGYDIPATINFKTRNNVEFVELTGADYYTANASYFFGSSLKFDATNDQIIIPTKSAFGDISIVALYNTGSTPTSTLKVYGSADGTSYTEIATPSFTHGSNVEETPDPVLVANSNSTYRYIKMTFTKATGNLAMGSISIAAPDLTPRINAENISGVAAIGVVDAEATYTVSNFADDVTVSGVTGCVSEAIADGGDIVYTVTANHTCAVRAGTIVLVSASNPSVTKTINVSQNASVFEASSTSPLNFVWDDYTNAEIKRITITSTYELTSSNVAITGTDAAKFEADITSNGSTNEYYLDVNVVEDNESGDDYAATVTVSRDGINIPISLKQAYKGGGIVKGATWTHSLASGDLSDAGATKSWTSGLLTMSWTHAFTWESSTHYLNWVGGSTNHYQIGASNNRAMTSLSLTSSDYTAGIESVTLTCCKATGSTVTIDVYVGGNKVAEDVAVSKTGTPTSAQKITFDKLYQGSLRIDFKQSTSSKAFYLKALQIN